MPATVTDPRVSHAAVLVLAGAVVVASWQTQYVAQHRQLRQARERWMSLRQQVEATEQLLQAAGGQAAWIAQSQAQLNTLTQRIPRSGSLPQLLDEVLRRAAQAKMKLVNVSQGNLEPVRDTQQQPIAVGQAPCLSLPVTVTFEGGFRGVVAFLEQVVDPTFPGLVTVDQARLTVNDSETGRLTASVQLVLYVLGS